MGREQRKKTFAGDIGDHKDIESNNNNNNSNSKAQQQLLQSNNKLKLAQQEDKLMSGHNNNSISINSNLEHAEKDTDSHNDKMVSYCFKKKWILCLSMTLFLLLTAVLVAMLTITLLENEDQCFNNFPFQQPSYKLFATKTVYSTAHNYLDGSATETHHDSINLPAIFSERDSLKALDEQLRLESACKVRQFHYFGRHAARFPNKKNILKINKLLDNVKARIDLTKFSLNNSNNNDPNKTQNTTNVCFNPLAPYKQWVSFMIPEQDNLVMESGYDETQAIARRFKSIYPQMFDANQTKIEFGTTEELRTAQTAIMFLKQVDNFPLDFCNLDQIPTGTPTDSSKAYDVQSNTCFVSFKDKYHLDKLKFHDRCDALHKEKVSISYNLNWKQPNITNFISSSVSKKLRLSPEHQLTSDETDAIYKICKFESASSGSSIWCNLFSDNDLKFYEYLDDLDDFFNQAFGHPDLARSACPITTELMNAFKAARSQDSSRSQPESHFYFTHSEVIAKILAASVDMEPDQDYSPANILPHLKDGTAPSSRQWRSSLFTPFSANLAFTLYECPKKAVTDKSTVFDVNDSSFKVVASLNERPIKLDGCKKYVCDLIELQDDSKINREKRCKLEDICRKEIVVT